MIVGAMTLSANRKAILKQSKQLAELGTDVESFLETELPNTIKQARICRRATLVMESM